MMCNKQVKKNPHTKLLRKSMELPVKISPQDIYPIGNEIVSTDHQVNKVVIYLHYFHLNKFSIDECSFFISGSFY